MARKIIPLETRFWAKVKKTATCWEWTASCFPTGYGLFAIQSRPQGAHRVSYVMHHGLIPEGLFVCHKCDNRKCVRPNHLFLGTQLDNMQDKCRKGRQARGDNHGSKTQPESRLRGNRNPARLHPELLARGESNGNSKLTAEQVHAIRRSAQEGQNDPDIAARFNVTPQLIRQIKHRRIWKHVD